ncbi:MAG: hypothetical protein QOK31_945 [Solirubrobacteraceae bacterium]|nr:hypothetical protein [Solirubrobacteraceae bacterium]
MLPPGANGLTDGPQLLAFEADHTSRPPHNDDQLAMYRDLVFAAPHVRTRDIPRFFKDASFGVPAGQTESTVSPRGDVTIIRDKAFGVPHIYGLTRNGAMFGEGYAAARDRLFFIDILRHAGRAELAPFVGGAAGNRAMDEGVWRSAPYREADLQAQIDRFPKLYGHEGAILQSDLTNFAAGINAYIAAARLPQNKLTMMPGEYAAINQPQGPDDWKSTDVIATAALIGGIFGKGGGAELQWAKLLQGFQSRFGARRGYAAFHDFRSPDDPEAPTTVVGHRFPYRTLPRHVARGSVAMPDRGSAHDVDVVTAGMGSSSGASTRSAPSFAERSGLLALPHSESNALLVSARESRSGHPEVVFGPQVGYFAPQILMEQDVHAPTIDANGATFPGVNLYVELGRGRDYSWSATSAGQDIVDTFAVDLCAPNGGKPSINSNFYRFRGHCLAMDILSRTNSWAPSAADQTPPGTETLTTARTKLGLVTARARIHGKPVAYTSLRSTYFHEVDSARGFSDFNDPAKMRNPKAFQRAAAKIGFTFNWLYTDDKHIAYFNSGNNPVRSPNTNPLFPVHARFEWRHFNPDLLTASYTPARQHPQAVDQSILTSWNNKQAPGYAAPDTDATYTPVYRSQTLDDRLHRAILGRRKASLADVINAMEDAGTVDLRGDKVLPLALRILGRPRSRSLRHAVNVLAAWTHRGAHRRDFNRNGRYDQAEAVRIMDAWWPGLVKADFGSSLGSRLLAQLEAQDPIDNAPHNDGDRLGSAYDVGFYGHLNKDLRAVLHRRVRGRYSRVYCGRGSLRSCRAALAASLQRAIAEPAAKVYPADGDCAAGAQLCFDEIRFRPLGAVTQPLMPWINRPTFQQAVEIRGHGSRR